MKIRGKGWGMTVISSEHELSYRERRSERRQVLEDRGEEFAELIMSWVVGEVGRDETAGNNRLGKV